jgi:DNA-binding MarR family transcriptional regulator
MERWGYIIVAPDPAGKRPKPPQADWIVRPTNKGRMAQEVWAPLFGEIEDRWRERFGAGRIDGLRASLEALVSRFDLDLPEYLPILEFGLRGTILESTTKIEGRSGQSPEKTTLPALLSKVLLVFALEFERESEVSLAICANVLRLFADGPVRVRDLPRLSGVSREAIHMATGFLRARKLASIEADANAPRVKLIRLTPKGEGVRKSYKHLLAEIEERWRERFGAAAIGNLYGALIKVIGEGEAQYAQLFQGMKPYPEGWRAKLPTPETLPHYPMVLHRGGFPDGS